MESGQMSKYTDDEIADADKFLRSILRPGTVVYTKINHVARSGMSRSITAYAIVDGELVYLSGYAARILDEKLDRYDGITLSGCGMDMGFELVYRLSRKLYPRGFPRHHGDGGYALRQRWI
jgi:hypothetical protein